ncbi:MAG: hypothetical protein ACPL7D_06475 [Candidatus Sumerlaeaceae bacterium]
MIPKGRTKDPRPEKMPVITCGIEMSRGQKSKSPEKLTGGNQPADESQAAKLVCEYLRTSQ